MGSHQIAPETPGRRTLLTIALVLLALAAIPRFHALGELGFYGDEETTAFPARAVALGGAPEMPSGMPYYRAFPFTLCNAASAAIFGVDEELSYRVPAALFGTLTVPIFFLFACGRFRWDVATLASLWLALSEWHIAVSREARMYAPFLLLFLLTVFAFWNWVDRRKAGWLAVALAFFVICISVHTLGRLSVVVCAVPVLIPTWRRVPVLRIAGLALAMGVGSQLLSERLILAPYKKWVPDDLGQREGAGGPFPDWIVSAPGLAFLAGLLLFGLWLAWSVLPRRGWKPELDSWRKAAVAGSVAFLCALVGVASGFGFVHAVGMLLFMVALILPRGAWALLRLPVAIVAVVCAGHVVRAVALHGLDSGIKAVTDHPFSYLLHFHELGDLMGLLFVVGGLTLVLREPRESERSLRAAALGTLFLLYFVGLYSTWTGRYVLEVYPLMLLVAAWVALAGARALLTRLAPGREQRLSLAALAGVTLVGLFWMHGIPAAVRASSVDYGDETSQLIYAHPVYPDHKGPGEFLAARLGEDDIVIAEDALQQRWYVGRVDYWLRDPDLHAVYLYRDDDGRLTDIYVSSRIPTIAELERSWQPSERKVWLVTSGETANVWHFALDEARLAWLQEVFDRREPLFVGADGVTEVYCINCE